MDPLIDRREYAGLANCTYLNQESLGLIPRVSLEASTRFLTDIAQYGNLRLSDQAEAEILDSLRAAAAELLGAPVASGRGGGRSQRRPGPCWPPCCLVPAVRWSWSRVTSRA